MMTVNNKLPSFQRSLYSVADDALREAGRDTLIKAKDKAPYKKGGLRSNSIVEKVKQAHYRVSFWIEYARYQEFGGDAKHHIRNYTSSNTGKHFLKNAGDEMTNKIPALIKKHGQRAKA